MKATYEITIYQGDSYQEISRLKNRLQNYLAWKRAKDPILADGKITYQLRNGLEVTYFRDNPKKTLEIIATGDQDIIEKNVGLLKRLYFGEINIYRYFGVRPKKEGYHGIGWSS